MHDYIDAFCSIAKQGNEVRQVSYVEKFGVGFGMKSFLNWEPHWFGFLLAWARCQLYWIAFYFFHWKFTFPEETGNDKHRFQGSDNLTLARSLVSLQTSQTLADLGIRAENKGHKWKCLSFFF